MATYYNPRVVTSNLKIYFDSLNPKSYISGNLYSILGPETIITWANTSDGFILSNGVQSLTTQLTSIENANSLTVVVSLRSDTNSKGTAFSLYGGGSGLYVGSDIITAEWSFANSNAITTVALTSNTNANTLLSNVGFHSANSNAITTVALTSNTAANTLLSNVELHSANVNVLSTVALTSNTVSNTLIANAEVMVSNTSTISTEIGFDIPDYGITVYLDYDSVGVRYKSNNYDTIVKGSFTPSLNDIVSVVYNSTANNVTLYLNRDMISQSGTDTSVKLFGTNLSMTNINGQGSPSNFPVRSLLVYDRELTQQEIQQISNAIRKI